VAERERYVVDRLVCFLAERALGIVLSLADLPALLQTAGRTRDRAL